MTTPDEIHHHIVNAPWRAWRPPVTLAGAILLATLCCAAWLARAEFTAAAEEKGAAAEAESSDQDAEQTEEKETSGDQGEETAMQEEADRPVEEEPPPEETGAATPAPPVEPEKKPPVKKKKHIIGATAVLMEKKSELLFRARVDSGAKSCSLHIEELIIEEEAEKMADNIGKLVRFKIQNGKDETWLTEKIAGYVIIKTADNRERRYKVPLTLRWKDVEKTVLVTLNNRKKMEYPLLVGRNYLKGDFLVDVDIDSDD